MAQMNGPDLEALASLRPGMPAARVAEAMGSAWREPAPHKGGIVDVLQNSHGLIVRLDRDGLVGRVTYDWRFREASVEGLRMGMTLDEARAALPALDVDGDLPMMRGVRLGGRPLGGDVHLTVKFTLETVNTIEVDNRAAAYAEIFAPPYPQPAGEPGAPFADINFKLVVLSSLLHAKAIDLGTPQQLASHVLGRPVDLEEEGYEPIPEVIDYLARFPLGPELLGEARSIVLDGGNEIYAFGYYFWGGDDDSYDVSDLSGIQVCPNIESVEVVSMIDRIDLAALAPLERLSYLSIAVDFSNPQALLEMRGLRELRLLGNEVYEDAVTPRHEMNRIMTALRERGVALHVQPMVWSGDTPPILR